MDLPFEPNDQWVRLTPGLEVRLRSPSITGSSYSFAVETRPEEQYGRPLALGDALPNRLVVARQTPMRQAGRSRTQLLIPTEQWTPFIWGSLWILWMVSNVR